MSARYSSERARAHLARLLLERDDVERAEQVLTVEGGLPEDVETRLVLGALLKAIKKVHPSTAEWLETTRNYASYANHAGQYGDLVEFFAREGR